MGACPCAKPRVGALVVGVWNLCFISVPAIVYLISHVMQMEEKSGKPGLTDPFNVFGTNSRNSGENTRENNDELDKMELLFYLLYFIPPAVLSFMTGVLILMTTYLENHALAVVSILFETVLLIGSGFILIFMTVVHVEYWFILPLLIPTLSQFYFLWVLTDYKYELKIDSKPSSMMYDYQK